MCVCVYVCVYICTYVHAYTHVPMLCSVIVTSIRVSRSCCYGNSTACGTASVTWYCMEVCCYIYVHIHIHTCIRKYIRTTYVPGERVQVQYTLRYIAALEDLTCVLHTSFDSLLLLHDNGLSPSLGISC